jgi:hypothetical protein
MIAIAIAYLQAGERGKYNALKAVLIVTYNEYTVILFTTEAE